VLRAAKFLGEIAGIDRFTSDAQLARMASYTRKLWMRVRKKAAYLPGC
jgi:hypothetical protein